MPICVVFQNSGERLTMEVVARFFQGVPEDEKSKIVRENAIKLYGLDLDEQSACR